MQRLVLLSGSRRLFAVIVSILSRVSHAIMCQGNPFANPTSPGPEAPKPHPTLAIGELNLAQGAYIPSLAACPGSCICWVAAKEFQSTCQYFTKPIIWYMPQSRQLKLCCSPTAQSDENPSLNGPSQGNVSSAAGGQVFVRPEDCHQQRGRRLQVHQGSIRLDVSHGQNQELTCLLCLTSPGVAHEKS